MKRLFLYTFTVFTLLSCGGSQSQFRLEGEFEHLQQGEFYIYSMDGYSEKPDTIKINAGQFRYDANIDKPVVFHLLYPNYSEQVIFASPGENIKITGDARHLKATKVSGSEANEAMTAFRLENQDKNEKDIRQAAANFIEKSPESPVSLYLFEQYFLINEKASKEETRKHFLTIKKAHSENFRNGKRKSTANQSVCPKVSFYPISNLHWKTVKKYRLLTFRANTCYSISGLHGKAAVLPCCSA